LKPAWSPPAEFDEYTLLQPIGQGQMGSVYLAYDTLLARYVAVKFVSALDPSAAARQRFLTEARAAARLQHPNVVTIYRVGELDQRPYIISEFVRGESLDKMSKPVHWTRALEIGIGLARGLATAHRKGVLHRDIKPANVIIAEDGNPKLLDFGLAKLIEGPREVAAVAALRRTESPRTSSGVPATLPPEPVENTDAESADDGAKVVPFPTRRVMAPAAPGLDRDAKSFTHAGAIMGTPDYMSPEAWRGEPATRASDVYSLGVVLYELCADHVPFENISLTELPRVVQERDVPPLNTVAPQVDPRFASIVDRCLRRDPSERFASGDELREALENLARTATGAAIPAGNPYRGLRPFEAEHRALFFGRTLEIGVILDRLRSEPFVLVTGESGVGKSSVCRAGVLPRVASGALEGGRTWSTVSFVPGRHPLTALTVAFATHVAGGDRSLAQRLGADPAALVQELPRFLGNTLGLVCFVDQLEELVTVSEPTEAVAVEEMLARLAAGIPGVRVLATVRADLLTRLAALPHLGEELSRSLYFLRPLTPERIREVIVGPAQITGVSFESEALVDELVQSTEHASGGLPLLQFALAQLWEARDAERNLVTARALESLGGVTGALARHADSVLADLLPAQRRAARRVLLRLVTIEGTRVRRTDAELGAAAPEVRAALDALVRGRLVVAHEAEGGGAYEIAHEALIRGWPALREWLHEDSEGRAARERIGQAAAEWIRLGRSREALWGARQLREAERIDPGDLSEQEGEFLERSRRAVRRGRRARVALAAGIPLLVLAVYAALELKARHEIRERIDAHLQGAAAARTEAAAQGEQAEALRLRAFTLFDAGKLDDAERVWAEARAASARAERAQLRASQALEAALALDASRPDVRSLFSEVLYQRALLAERDRSSSLAELLQRLALYDDSEEQRRRWDAPATLAVRTTPAGARVALRRFVDGGNGKLRLEKARDLGTTPIESTQLPRGSYVLLFELAGRAPVRYPVLLGRGESLEVVVDLPPASAVPEGYVYIPAGRFLFGSAAEDDVRRGFFETAPLHEVRTGSYLIGRTEVTFGEWIEFLESLTRSERARHMPFVPGRASGATGSLKLEKLANGWQLTIGPAGKVYSAMAGEPMRYPGRDRRREQNWLGFPVVGITADDALAYLQWLSGTGRVPGARLCSEYEWERAARGADDRIFPHGHRLDPDDANYDETYGKAPSAMGPDEVGSHPISRSPFGLDDLSGNAWEWTTTSFGPGRFLIRGGSYFYTQKTNQVVNRQVVVPTVRDASVGMRVCASIGPR
jgi:serine/threonine protein kinase/formylglycine-generating enzyme required for sulfatase activity